MVSGIGVGHNEIVGFKPMRISNIYHKVDAPIMSQPVLWVIHANKCGSVQLLGQCNIYT